MRYPPRLTSRTRAAYAVHMRVEIIVGDAVTVAGTASLDQGLGESVSANVAALLAAYPRCY